MTEQHSDPIGLATSYLHSWQRKDFETLRATMAHDVTFRGPLGEANGIEECLAGLTGLAEMITEINIVTMLADDRDVITWYELHTRNAAPTPTVNWSRVTAGKISQIRVTFDPRGLLGDGR